MKETNRKIDDLGVKMDSTCERLTIQETNYKNHIENEQKQRQESDEKIDRKYLLWSTLSSVGTFLVALVEIKNKYF